jgi:SHS family sialic acid transporter-like MFS transporter
MIPPKPPAGMSSSQRITVLVAAFLGWMFAGYQISLFVLIHRSAMISMMSSPNEAEIKQWFAWFQAAFMLGAAAGGWIFGVLGDRFGRTKSLGWSVLCYSLFTAACYLARTPEELIVFRFLACLGVGGAWPNTVALVAEAWPDASRPFLAGLLGAAANVGQVLMGCVGLVSDISPESWRWTLLVSAAPALIGMWCLVAVPESLKWLASLTEASVKNTGPIRELFQPSLRYRTIFGILLGAVPVVGTGANAQWIVLWSEKVHSEELTRVQPASPQDPATDPSKVSKPKGGKTKEKTAIFRSSGAIIGSLTGGYLAGLLGRRVTYFAISLLTLVASTVIFGWMDPSHPWFFQASFVFGLVGVIYFGWLPLYLPELFPTRVRASGTGISFNTGRIVAAVVALGTGVMLKQFGGDYARIGLWTGLIYGVGMIVILFAPRTDASSLRD